MTFPQPFSAVLLAGGKSTRMGSDKAALSIGGEPLWARQLAKLRGIGADELLISGPADGPYSRAPARVVPDRVAAIGPLGGLDAALRSARNEWLLVLAVDLIDVREEFLTTLTMTALTKTVGLVPALDDWFQPLAAIYPRECISIVERCIEGADHSMRRFFRLASEAGLVSPYPVDVDERAYFQNLNTPADLERRRIT